MKITGTLHIDRTVDWIVDETVWLLASYELCVYTHAHHVYIYTLHFDEGSSELDVRVGKGETLRG